MTLSVLCPTRDPGPRVRALLEPLRPIADEIIIAADAATPAEHLGHYAAIADRVVRYERGPHHSSLAWLHAQCRGDWILLLAGDEVVSGALLDALPELIMRRDALQIGCSMRWLWPTPGHWLRDTPWYPDFQRRLVRNDGTLRFRGVRHELAMPVEPTRLLDLPLWHLSLLATDLPGRRAKAAANAVDRPGLQAPGGGELNAVYYLPEDQPSLAIEPVPAGERARIDAVWQATGPSLPVPDLPVIPRAEIEPLWDGRPISPDDPAPRCALRLLGPAVPRCTPGEQRTLFVAARNLGPYPWPYGADGLPPFRLGYGWLPPAHRLTGVDSVTALTGRATSPCTVAVGDEAIIPLFITAPRQPGPHHLRVDMLIEHVRWLDCPLDVLVEVR